MSTLLQDQLATAALFVLVVIAVSTLPLFPARLAWSFSTLINASPQAVFNAITDVRRWPQDQPDAIVEIIAITPEPLQQGSLITYRFKVRGDAKVGSDQVVGYTPGRLFWLRAAGKASGGEVYSLSPQASGTRLDYSWSSHPRLPLISLIPPSALRSHLRARQARKALLVAALKARIEAQAQTQS